MRLNIEKVTGKVWKLLETQDTEHGAKRMGHRAWGKEHGAKSMWRFGKNVKIPYQI
jgi:hypothetical protein